MEQYISILSSRLLTLYSADFHQWSFLTFGFHPLLSRKIGLANL
nr:MAG TPA: hypothetical protein [Caudoviricetes sp.]